MKEFLAVLGFFFALNLIFLFIDWFVENCGWWFGPLIFVVIFLFLFRALVHAYKEAGK